MFRIESNTNFVSNTSTANSHNIIFSNAHKSITYSYMPKIIDDNGIKLTSDLNMTDNYRAIDIQHRCNIITSNDPLPIIKKGPVQIIILLTDTII